MGDLATCCKICTPCLVRGASVFEPIRSCEAFDGISDDDVVRCHMGLVSILALLSLINELGSGRDVAWSQGCWYDPGQACPRAVVIQMFVVGLLQGHHPHHCAWIQFRIGVLSLLGTK